MKSVLAVLILISGLAFATSPAEEAQEPTEALHVGVNCYTDGLCPNNIKHQTPFYELKDEPKKQMQDTAFVDRLLNRKEKPPKWSSGAKDAR